MPKKRLSDIQPIARLASVKTFGDPTYTLVLDAARACIVSERLLPAWVGQTTHENFLDQVVTEGFQAAVDGLTGEALITRVRQIARRLARSERREIRWVEFDEEKDKEVRRSTKEAMFVTQPEGENEGGVPLNVYDQQGCSLDAFEISRERSHVTATEMLWRMVLSRHMKTGR